MHLHIYQDRGTDVTKVQLVEWWTTGFDGGEYPNIGKVQYSVPQGGAEVEYLNIHGGEYPNIGKVQYSISFQYTLWCGEYPIKGKFQLHRAGRS